MIKSAPARPLSEPNFASVVCSDAAGVGAARNPRLARSVAGPRTGAKTAAPKRTAIGANVLVLLTAAPLLLELLLILRALRRRNALRALNPACPPAPDPPEVHVVVPARNEAVNILDCLTTLAAQTYPSGKLRIAVVDDQSEDNTPRIVAAFAKDHPGVTLLQSGPLREGWTGKTQACWTGALAASPDSKWLCFIDGDVQADPALIASAVAEGETGVGLLSLAPRHRLGTFAERLMIPCGHYLLSFRQSLATPAMRSGSDVSVAGQFMLVRRSLYQSLGGHEAVAGAICEDLQLARLIKRAGASVIVMDASRLLSTRMYRGLTSLWLGFSKNVVQTFGGIVPSLATAAAGFLFSWWVVALPFVDVAKCAAGSREACVASGLAAPAFAAAIGFHIAGSIYFGVPFWYAFLFPLGYTLGAGIVLDGVRRRMTGRIAWKGRIYQGRIYQ